MNRWLPDSRNVERARVSVRRTIHIAGAVALVVLTRAAFGQPKPDTRVTVVTVCEVLSDPAKYSGTVVLLVARMESSTINVDRFDWLSEDGCEHPITTEARVWPNTIHLESSGLEGLPEPPGDKVEIDDSAVAVKLSAIQKTTKLGSHKHMYGGVPGSGIRSVWVDEPNAWVVVYGRIVTAPHLGRRYCDPGVRGVERLDCFGFLGAPVGIVVADWQQNIHRLSDAKVILRRPFVAASTPITRAC